MFLESNAREIFIEVLTAKIDYRKVLSKAYIAKINSLLENRTRKNQCPQKFLPLQFTNERFDTGKWGVYSTAP